MNWQKVISSLRQESDFAKQSAKSLSGTAIRSELEANRSRILRDLANALEDGLNSN